MPNVMAALPNIGGALCSTPQSVANAQYTRVPGSKAAKTRNPLKFAGVPQTTGCRSSPYCGDIWGRYWCLISFFRLLIRALIAKI